MFVCFIYRSPFVPCLPLYSIFVGSLPSVVMEMQSFYLTTIHSRPLLIPPGLSQPGFTGHPPIPPLPISIPSSTKALEIPGRHHFGLIQAIPCATGTNTYITHRCTTRRSSLRKLVFLFSRSYYDHGASPLEERKCQKKLLTSDIISCIMFRMLIRFSTVASDDDGGMSLACLEINRWTHVSVAFMNHTIITSSDSEESKEDTHDNKRDR